MGHFIGDFILQNDRITVKNAQELRCTSLVLGMIAHSACHGLITATIKFTVNRNSRVSHPLHHWLLQMQKQFNLLTDQILHLICKIS